jgi:hypothetical protein
MAEEDTRQLLRTFGVTVTNFEEHRPAFGTGQTAPSGGRLQWYAHAAEGFRRRTA